MYVCMNVCTSTCENYREATVVLLISLVPFRNDRGQADVNGAIGR